VTSIKQETVTSIKQKVEVKTDHLPEQFEMLASLNGEDVSQLDLGLKIPKNQNELCINVAVELRRSAAQPQAVNQTVKEQLSKGDAPAPSD
jgi:hypothetical protein